jgi:methionyl-tRNA formyltransferase
MKVVFMGTPGFACNSLETLATSHHELLAVVTVPDKPSGRGRKLSACDVKIKALELQIPVLQPEKLRNQEFLGEITALNADVFVVIAFRILPKKLYSIPPLGSINIHGSLLPKLRGAAPINHALLNGETETGLTSFFLTKQVDGGDIISRVSTAIDPNENFSSLYNRLSEMAGPFLLETLDMIEKPGFSPKKQDVSLATPAPKIKPEDCLIDWAGDDRQVHNHIRAFSEKPGAFCFLDNMKIKILGSLRETQEALPDLEPGEMCVDGKKLYVGTGQNPLQLTTLQPEGKRAMDAASFINGYRIKPHQKLLTDRKEVIS